MKKSPKIEIIQSSKKRSIRNIKLNKNNIAYFSAFIVIITVAVIGSNLNSKADQLNSISKTESTSTVTESEATTSAVDEITESSVVANLADTANLAVAPNTASLSVSVSVLQESGIQNAGVVEKPKILEVSSDKREIVVYTTTQEEVIQAIADKYGITAQTIKWVNKLKGDAVEAGKEIRILPVDGIVYTIKSGDNLEEVAKKYQADIERILSYNGLKSVSEAKEGQEIVIPGGILPEEERPDYVAPRTYTHSSSSVSSSIGVASANYNVKAGNAYAWGNCTWYVYNRRPDIGSFWGNASSWAASARAAGYLVDQNPTVGAIAQWNAYAGGSYGWGHVGVVESVNGDGTVTISDMNYAGALGRVTTRTVPASSVSNYIH